MPPLAIIAAVGAAGAIGGAAISAHAAGKAADTQSNAAMYAADLQKKSADEALAFQKQQWETQQQNLAPWLTAGKGALGQLTGQLPGWEASLGKQFQAPTNVTEQNDPGYQFRLQQGMKALENSAAAKGGLLSGNLLQGEQNYAQNYASNEYGNVYNRAFQQYQSNRQNVLDQYNMLAGLAGTGQAAANTLGQQGQQAAGNVSNIMLTSGQQQANGINNAAAARASGYVGGANAWANGLSGVTNNLMNMWLLNQMQYGGGYGG